MGRILAIDYGRKRTGVAVTDPLKMIANNLGTVPTHEIWKFFEDYFKKEQIELMVVGEPKQLNNEPSESVKYLQAFLNRFKKLYPDLKLVFVDERFTSKIALQAMIDGGMKKKKRQDKAIVDGISATIILQSYLEMNNR